MGADLAAAERPPQTPETKGINFSLKINNTEIPWLPTESHIVRLIKMKGATGHFLFGSAIQGKALVEAAQQLDSHRSDITNNLMYTHIPPYAEGFNPHVKIVENPRTNQPIFYVGNKGGQRVYFLRFGRIDNMPVIVRIAACDKATQREVLSTITTTSRRNLKAVHNVS